MTISINSVYAGDDGWPQHSFHPYISKDKFTTPDKLTHFQLASMLTTEFSNLTKNKWTGSALSFGVMTLNEVKDAYFDYRDFGGFGGDGFSWRDEVANGVGCTYGILAYKPSVSVGKRPMKEFWIKTAHGAGITAGWIGGWAVYNKIANDHWFPRSKWMTAPDKGLFISLNSETSIVMPWAFNSWTRNYMSLEWRSLGSLVLLGLFETGNGLIRDSDVPFIGDEKGFDTSDIIYGTFSTMGCFVYERWIYPHQATQKISVLPYAGYRSIGFYARF